MSSMKSGTAASCWLACDELVEILALHLAAADLVGRDPRFLGEDAGGELLGRHFQREEADDRAVLGDRAMRPSVARRLVGLGGVEGDVGGERGLAHRGAAGEDDQVGGVQAAELLVEIDEAGGDAGDRGRRA